MSDQATLDAELYSFATMRMEARALGVIDQAIDKDKMARWFAEQLREAYSAGLRDGYVQGRHDKHKEGEMHGGYEGS
jgi:hypothetical protein